MPTPANVTNMDPALAIALRESAAAKAVEELREAGFSASTGYVNGQEGFQIHGLRGDLSVVVKLTDERPAMMLVGLTPVPAPSAESVMRSTKPDAADSGARPVRPRGPARVVWRTVVSAAALYGAVTALLNAIDIVRVVLP